MENIWKLNGTTSRFHRYFHPSTPPLSACTDEKLLLLDRDGIIGRPCLFMAFIFLEIAGEDGYGLSRATVIFLRQHVDSRFMKKIPHPPKLPV
ncbi:hypothetical protein ANTQUA_LOCUS9147 [Anthophora quadrimaculata]